MGLSIMYLKGPQIVISQLLSNSIPEDCFTLTNSVDLDEMRHDVAFHLGLHSLSKNCKFGNFHEDFIFAKLRICKVS